MAASSRGKLILELSLAKSRKINEQSTTVKRLRDLDTSGKTFTELQTLKPPPEAVSKRDWVLEWMSSRAGAGFSSSNCGEDGAKRRKLHSTKDDLDHVANLTKNPDEDTSISPVPYTVYANPNVEGRTDNLDTCPDQVVSLSKNLHDDTSPHPYTADTIPNMEGQTDNLDTGSDQVANLTKNLDEGTGNSPLPHTIEANPNMEGQTDNLDTGPDQVIRLSKNLHDDTSPHPYTADTIPNMEGQTDNLDTGSDQVANLTRNLDEGTGNSALPHTIEANPNMEGQTDNLDTDPDEAPKRRRTLAQKTMHNLKSHQLLPPCSETRCRKKCNSIITKTERESILMDFWSLDFCGRSLFFDGHINIRQPKFGKGVKTKSLVYYLQNQRGIKVPVCKTMFLSTLGLKTDGMVTEFLKRKSVSQASTRADLRGRSEPPNKEDPTEIITHINSFNPSTSHYRREHAPFRRYLDCYLTVQQMHKDYLEKGGRVSYETYRGLFAKEKISFGFPPQDECETCEIFKAHVHNEHTANEEECDICLGHADHIKRAQEARNEYRQEVGEDVDMFTADMQKVILLPKMTTKEHFFVSRLVVFNETFARKTEGEDLVILWHEGIAGRSAADVASSYIKVLGLTEKPHTIFWADNCSAQNKNWSLYSALVTCVNEEWGPESVTIKYLEKGHTFMKADSIHGAIGGKMKKEKEILYLEEFVRLCQKATKSIQTVEMQATDFFNFKALNRSNSNKTVKMPKLHDVVEVKFIKGKQTLHCREHSFATPLREVDFLKPSARNNLSMPTKMQVPRGIPQAKKDGILALLRATPHRGGLKFWHEMPVSNDARDLARSMDY